MKFINAGAELYIPDGTDPEDAVGRTTHLAIAAHQDDVEIMAYDGINQCFAREDRWFMAAVAADGAGSPRNGSYSGYTDERMRQVRKQEQKKAAFIGEYTALALLDYSSASIKDPSDTRLVDEVKELVLKARPGIIYTHNLADKHDTHAAVALKVIRALRALPREALPEKVYGCEVWRNLDWMNDDEKVVFDVSGHPNISAALLGVFDSQICGGKRYDLAAEGRRLGNATFIEPRRTDGAAALSYAMDLTPLILDKDMDICRYVTGFIDRFRTSIAEMLRKL